MRKICAKAVGTSTATHLTKLCQTGSADAPTVLDRQGMRIALDTMQALGDYSHREYLWHFLCLQGGQLLTSLVLLMSVPYDPTQELQRSSNVDEPSLRAAQSFSTSDPHMVPWYMLL